MSSADHHALYLEAQIDKRDREIERLKAALHRIDDQTRDWRVREIARAALEEKT